MPEYITDEKHVSSDSDKEDFYEKISNEGNSDKENSNEEN